MWRSTNLCAVFDSPDFDLAPYAEFDMPAYVRRTYCSWVTRAGGRYSCSAASNHAPEADHLPLPAVSDLHLVLRVAGDMVMRTRADGNPVHRRWVPGKLELTVPGRVSVRDYRATSVMRTIQVHIPSATVDRAAAQLGGSEPDFEALSAAVGAGDPVVEHLLRALPSADGDCCPTAPHVNLTPTSDWGTIIHWHGTYSTRWEWDG